MQTIYYYEDDVLGINKILHDLSNADSKRISKIETCNYNLYCKNAHGNFF